MRKIYKTWRKIKKKQIQVEYNKKNIESNEKYFKNLTINDFLKFNNY